MSSRIYPEIIDIATAVANAKSDKISDDLRKDAKAVAEYHKVDWTQEKNDLSVFYPNLKDISELDKYVIPYLKRYNVLRDKVVSIPRFLTSKVTELRLYEPSNDAQKDFIESIEFLKQIRFAHDHYNALYHLLEWLFYDRRVSFEDKIDIFYVQNFNYSNDAQRWTDPFFIETTEKLIAKAIVLGIDSDYLGGYHLSNIKKVGPDGTISYDASETKAVQNNTEKHTDKQNEFWKLTEARFFNKFFEGYDLNCGHVEFREIALNKFREEQLKKDGDLH